MMPTTTPARPARRLRRAVSVIAALAIGIGLVGCSLLPSLDGGGGSVDSRPSAPAPAITALPVISIADRPGFDAADRLVNEMHERYSNEASADYAYDQVAQTTEAKYYAYDFLVILTDFKGAFRFMPLGTESTNPAELDAKIQYYVDEVTELERKFLAGEDLGVTISITKADGSVYTSDGTNTAAASTDAAEEFARGFTGAPDAAGSYAASAEQLAAEFGLSLTYDFTSIYAKCSHSGGSTENIVAAYCHVTPELIYVNTEWFDYPDNLNEASFVDSIKHELAHRLIGTICDTASPPITGSANEGVANSFAVLFLGADETYLASIADGYPAYAMTDQTDELARTIHDTERCA